MRTDSPKSYEYINSLLKSESEQMQQARVNSEKLGLGRISLSTVEASIIQFLLRDIKAKKVVEIGTLTGLSALYILEALPKDGKLWTLEKSEEHATLANQVLYSDPRCQVIVGDAKEKMQTLNSQGPFDLIFIDGNKAAYMDYFKWAMDNTAIGSMIVLDNIFLAGAVWADMAFQRFNDKQVSVMQAVNKMAFSDVRLSSMVVPTNEGLLVCKRVS